MPAAGTAIELSLIIPVLNEAEGIIAFIQGLAAQRGVSFQAILCDGGSTDGTVQKVNGLSGELPFPLMLIHTEKGRAKQMNAGAREASGEYVLFLHADSTFTDPYALSQGVSLLRQAELTAGGKMVAARFSLRFQVAAGKIPFPYYFAASKACLDRSGCTHGDQGFLMSLRFFTMAGPFDQSCPVMEDTFFAETVRARWSWQLLPVELVTSPRRFETEGFAVRQVLNMILMALAAVGRVDFLREMPGIYATQSMAGRLRMFPFLDKIRLLIRGLPHVVRVKFWYSVGRYVCLNAWQIPFYLDMRRNYRSELPIGEGKTPYLDNFSLYGEPLFKTSPVAVFTAGLTLLSFYCFRLLACMRGW
jgi:glycosyltransferase involved in cell wall biosynthesis